MTTIRIVLADDHVAVREGLRLLLESQGDMVVVGEASDATAAVAVIHRLLPDVALLDLSMPGGGIGAATHLMKAAPNVRLVALTRHADPGFLDEFEKLGAAGYVLKQSPSTVLLEAVRRAARGEHFVDPAMKRNATEPAARTRRRQTACLTTRETQVLRMIAQGLTNKEVAGTLGLSVKTVETHKANAMQRLNLPGRAHLVRYALTAGWLRDA